MLSLGWRRDKVQKASDALIASLWFTFNLAHLFYLFFPSMHLYIIGVCNNNNIARCNTAL